MAKRRFNDKWLEKQDPNNQLVSLWCSKKNDYTAACSFCKADISVDHMGFGSLKQHANGSKHKQLAGVSNISQEGKPKHQSSLSSFFIKSDPQPVKSETPPEKSVGASESTVKNCAWTLKQMTTKAEIIATLQYTDQNTPFASADNLGPCYQQQFPDSQIAKNVAIGHGKMSYVVEHGLGPYFAKLNVNNLVAGNSFFTLHFDETVTAQKRKQMDLLVRFWSEIHNEVKVKYLTSIMFGHAKAADVVTEIMQALENLSLPFKLMLSLGMDGPNVNKSILAKMNQLKKEKGYPELVQEREKKISVDIDNAMDCIKEARNLKKEGRMRDNMVSVESGEKGLDLGIEKETAGREKLKEVSTERQKIEKILLELKQFKKQRINAK